MQAKPEESRKRWRRRSSVVACLIAVALGLGACTVGPDYRRPAVPTPASFRGAPDGEAPLSLGDLAWWKLFEDEVLQRLIQEAVRENYDLKVAAARIMQARAQVTIARSFQFPELNNSGSATYTHIQGERSAFQFENQFAPIASLDLFFELDLWGRFRRSTEAARADLLSTVDFRRFVLSTLVTDVATAYFNLRSLDDELAVSRRTVTTREENLRLVKMREAGGVAGMIDVRQAEILLFQALEAVTDTERQIEQTENALSVLIGHTPEAMPRGRGLLQQITVPAVPVGVPSALFERRPDIRQAEDELAAATARIGVAKSDYFPRVFLTGAAAGGALHIDGSWIGPQGLFSIGPSLHLPIFNMGRTRAGVDSAEAQAQASVEQYRATIIQAFREVADSLVEHRKRRELRVQQEGLAVAATDASRLSNIRYKGGVTSYLEVLNSEQNQFDAEIGLVRTNRDELLAIVRLYKALGGGWQEEQENRTAASTGEREKE